MIQAILDKQLMIMAKDTIGSLAEVTSIISSSGINLRAICAYAIDDMVAVMFVTEDNNAAKKLLEEKSYTVQEEEVVLLTIDNTPGSFQRVTDKFTEAGIDLSLVYGSVDKEAKKTCIVLISKNNLDIMLVVKMLLERM
jgi:hypothetical protein